MGVKFANNAYGTLNASIASGDTSLTLSSGQGARFPSLGAGDYFYATLIDTSNNLEIVKCTARSSDVLTITRGQEGTTARAYAVGDRVELRVTAQALADNVGANLDGDKGDITVSSSGTVWSIDSNVVGATELNVSGNGTSGQALLSDGDGTMSWGGAGMSYYTHSQTTLSVGGTGPKTAKTMASSAPVGEYLIMAEFNWEDDAAPNADEDGVEFYITASGSTTVRSTYYRTKETGLNGGTTNGLLNGTLFAHVTVSSGTSDLRITYNHAFDGVNDADSGGWGGYLSYLVLSK